MAHPSKLASLKTGNHSPGGVGNAGSGKGVTGASEESEPPDTPGTFRKSTVTDESTLGRGERSMVWAWA